MANIRQVAELAGVSPITVSRVLGGPKGQFPVSAHTKQKVKAAAETLGYHVNYHMQAVSQGRANVMGFAVEVMLQKDIGAGRGDFYFDSIRRGIEYTTQEAGSAILTVHPGKGLSAVSRGIRYLQNKQLDALVAPWSSAISECISAHANRPLLPLVVVNPPKKIMRPSIVFDYQESFRLIVEHLVELGHRKVLALIPNNSLDSNIKIRMGHLNHFTQQAGMSVALCEVEHTDDGDFTEEVCTAFTPSLCDPDRAWTAIVAFNDFYAIAASKTIQAHGLHVPKDISLVGFDNWVAYLASPPLTTIDHCFSEMGQQAAELAASLIGSDDDTRMKKLNSRKTVKPKFVTGKSTAPASTQLKKLC